MVRFGLLGCTFAVLLASACTGSELANDAADGAVGQLPSHGSVETSSTSTTPAFIKDGQTTSHGSSGSTTSASMADAGHDAGPDSIRVFPLASEGDGGSATVPNFIAAGADGALWFTPETGDLISRMTKRGELTQFPTPTPGSKPEGITAGPDDAVWFTESAGNNIGRVTNDGTFKEFSIPTDASGPHGITVGPEGAIWFTEHDANKIGRLSMAGVFTEFPVPQASADPTGITIGPDGALWFVTAKGLSSVTTAGIFSHFPVPHGGAIRGIVGGPGNAVWFTQPSSRFVGSVDPSGTVTKISVPATGEGPVDITLGPDGALWCAAGEVLRVTTSGETSVFTVPMNSGMHLRGIANGPDKSLWFTFGSPSGFIGSLTP